MAGPSTAPTAIPFAAFNFAIELSVPGIASTACSAAFAECDGLEMSFDVKTVREGGNNGAVIRLAGYSAYGNLTLKRGMTESFDLWDWCTEVVRTPSLRADGEVVLFSPAGDERARFILSRCLPLKIKAPALNARDGVVAIEELQLAYESLRLRRPGASGG